MVCEQLPRQCLAVLVEVNELTFSERKTHLLKRCVLAGQGWGENTHVHTAGSDDEFVRLGNLSKAISYLFS